MKVCVFIPTYKRSKMLLFTLSWLFGQTVKPQKVIVVGSDPGDRIVTDHYPVNYYEHPNLPLHKKVQAAVNYCREFDPDVIMPLGSDDWLSENWIEKLLPTLDEHDVAGTERLYLLNCEERPLSDGILGRLIVRVRYGLERRMEPMGPGRMISSRILDKVDWELYPPGLDGHVDGTMFGALKKAGAKTYLHTDDQVKLLCPKGYTENMNSWRHTILNSEASVVESPMDWLGANFPGAIEMRQSLVTDREDQT